MITMQVSFAGFRAELAPHYSAFAVQALWEHYRDCTEVVHVGSILTTWLEYLDVDDFNADNGAATPTDTMLYLENGGILCKI